MARPTIRHYRRSVDAEHRATVAAGFVRGLLSAVPASAPLLARVGLGRENLGDGHRTPIAAYAELYNAVVEELRDEGFGLFAAPLRPGTFEFLCRSAIGASTLGEALDRAARFLAVVLPDLSVEVRIEGATARLEIVETRKLRARTSDPRRIFAFEWLLRLLHGLACWLAGRALTLDAVAFPFPPPPHVADYARIYTEHSSFDAPRLSAAFAPSLLVLPVRRSEPDLAAFLVGAPGKIAMLYRRDREMAAAVRATLEPDLASLPELDEVARRLHLSPRTLHRRLAEEGTSYRAVKDALRRERALHFIETSTERVASVASRLGYSEPSAFFRAFVSWTGMAPTLWRKRNVSA